MLASSKRGIGKVIQSLFHLGRMAANCSIIGTPLGGSDVVGMAVLSERFGVRLGGIARTLTGHIDRALAEQKCGRDHDQRTNSKLPPTGQEFPRAE